MRKVALGIGIAIIVLGTGGLALADGGAVLTPAGQRDAPDFGFLLEQRLYQQPTYQVGQPIVITWFLLPPYHVGKIWIDSAGQPADPSAPPSTARRMDEQSGVVTLPGPTSPGAYQIRAADLTHAPELIATEDLTVAAPGASTTATAAPQALPAHVAAGRYACHTNGSLQRVTIASDATYTAAGTRGRYRFSRAGQLLRFQSGYLRGAVARYEAGSRSMLVITRNGSTTDCSLAGA
jgi:hypothetical protein